MCGEEVRNETIVFRGGPLEITGGGRKNFSVDDFFLFFFCFFLFFLVQIACMNFFFFFDVEALHDFFFFSTALLLSYFGSVYLQEFFLKGELLARNFFIYLLLLLFFFFLQFSFAGISFWGIATPPPPLPVRPLGFPKLTSSYKQRLILCEKNLLTQEKRENTTAITFVNLIADKQKL